jgi:hypothetical protein
MIVSNSGFDSVLGQHWFDSVSDCLDNKVGRDELLEQCSLTGGRHNSLAISVFLIRPASSRDIPFTLSVMYDDEAIALPQPKVLNLTSEMIPSSLTLI